MKDMIQRAELNAHTKLGPMNACTDICTLFERAKQKGITAIAVTDTNSVRAFRMAEQAAREYGVKLIYGCELLMETGGGLYPILVYAREQKGLRNLHELVSLALGREDGWVTREEVQARRYGLLTAGARELWYAYMNNRPLTEKLRFYDAVAFTLEDLETAPGLIELVEEAGVPAFLAGDVRYTDEEDKIAYTILKSLPPVNEEKRHLMSAEELMRETGSLPERTLLKLIENSIRFADLFTGKLDLYPDGDRMTLIEIEAGEKIKDLAMEKARVLYGEVLPAGMEKRITEETENAVRGGQAHNLLLLNGIFSRFRIPAKICGGDKSLLLHLLGICDAAPLPQNILFMPLPKFEHGNLMFLVPEGALLPVYPSGPLMRCAPLSLTEPEDAYAMISRLRKKFRLHLSPKEAERAIKGLTGIARGVMRDPDTYFLFEEGLDPMRYGPMREGVLQLDNRDVQCNPVRFIGGDAS